MCLMLKAFHSTCQMTILGGLHVSLWINYMSNVMIDIHLLQRILDLSCRFLTQMSWRPLFKYY